MKNFIKNITPPFLYESVKKLLLKEVRTPRWYTFTYKPLSGMHFFFDPTGPWQKKMVEDGYDNFMFEGIKHLAPENKVIYDIGAHVGFHSFYFSKLVGNKGRVIAFEPNKKNVERLGLNLSKNTDITNIDVYDAAIGDKDGEVEFMVNNDIESGRSTGGFIEEADTTQSKAFFSRKGFVTNKVPIFKLDSVMQKLGIKYAPDIIKIDVEGAEAQVLEGARDTIIARKPTLLIEIHSISAMLHTSLILNELSYRFKIIHKETDGRCYIEATPK